MERRCERCPEPLGKGRRRYCEPCAVDVERERRRERQRRRRRDPEWRAKRNARRRAERREGREARNPDLRCAGCGSSLAGAHGNTKYCDECREAKGRERNTSYQKRRRAADPEYRRRHRGRWRYRRHLVVLLVRQEGRCGICREALPGDDPAEWHVDHIRPQAVGGSDDEDNCQVVCADCNMLKGDAWEGNDEAQVARWAPWKV